jgi:hypothetical protein
VIIYHSNKKQKQPMNIVNNITKSGKAFLTFIVISLLSTIAFAQDKGVDIKITKESSSNWYAQPWVWIVGGAVFILLLVALMRGNNNK